MCFQFLGLPTVILFILDMDRNIETESDAKILRCHILPEWNLFVTEQFLQSLVKRHGKNQVSTDDGTWYPQACKILKS